MDGLPGILTRISKKFISWLPPAMDNLFSLAPTTSFFLSDSICLKFLLSPESALSHSPLEYWKRCWSLFKKEMTIDNLTVDFQSLLLTLVSYEAQRFLTAKITSSISGPRQLYTCHGLEYVDQTTGKVHVYYPRQKRVDVVPDASYLATKIGSYLLVKAAFYPLTTAIVRLASRSVTFKDLPKLFTSTQNIRSLYSGFGYSMLWSACYASLSGMEDLLNFYHYTKSTEEASTTRSRSIFLGAYSVLGVVGLAVVPLRLRGLFAQAEVPFTLSPVRYITGMGLGSFSRN